MAKQAAPIDQNDLARDITEAEGGKQSLSIAQVKEVLRLTLEALAKHRPASVLKLVYAHKKAKDAAPSQC